MTLPVVVVVLAAIPLLPLLTLFLIKAALRGVGAQLQSSTKGRREAITLQVTRDLKAARDDQTTLQENDDGWERIEKNGKAGDRVGQDTWSGIVGFFHPFCNAGGGGERVLWAAIAATQKKWPNAICAVYTGDHDIERSIVVATVKDRFGITLYEPTLHFIYLSTRQFVLASSYPHLTLLGQSLGSLVLAYDAFHLLTPDIFIDTMGYAFAVAFCKYLFPTVPTAAYVHYPTISTDMLQSLDDTTGSKGIHSGAGAGWKGRTKKAYWQAFAWLYGWVGRRIDVVMCNSSWTRGHISQLWKPRKTTTLSPSFATIVYPPCPVEELEAKISVDQESEKKRNNVLLYIAQFRPEKNHSLILRSFAKYYHSAQQENPRLVLIGSVRSNTPDEKHVYNLRLEARELKVQDVTTFICDAPFSLIQDYLQTSNISVNGMFAEHFGIGNVEGISAGLIPVVHNSGGPKLDIVVPYEGKAIGYHAETVVEFAEAFAKIGKLTTEERLAMRIRGRKSAKRFTEEAFAKKWLDQMEILIKMQRAQHR